MATIFPLSPTIGQQYGGYEWNGTAWTVIGIDLNQDYATQTELDTHTIDTTSIHGISDTANLIYTNDSRLSDSRTPTSHASSHGVGQSDAITIAQSQVTNLTTDLSAKSPIASPTFTGTPAAPTATAGTNTTQIATTAYVQTALGGVSVGPDYTTTFLFAGS